MSEQNVIIKERKRWVFFGLPFTFTTYTLNERKLLINSGLLSSVEDEILLYRVLDLTLRKTLFQKLFGLGTVIVHAQDQTTPTLELKNIKNSHKFKELLSEQVEKEKSRLRIRKGEVISDGPCDCDDFSDINDTLNSDI
ncbi:MULTISPECIES: PH domain-containing protein [unclassified Ruminococcus]|uniref:PH domain-containing protein n=1 Tax=unclassified Ruminococcus TaxID=2608920 RepID=UPI00210B9383|nr:MULTISPECIES: PH domain-containing protein [unclassified Ruminococcus]MCQ4022968.1 PH domain-containing protein [Ruminococcus sp. zg-924]MCQ4115334.1 PH domain-containing protein [Ruminococcus sp. zg-921]